MRCGYVSRDSAETVYGAVFGLAAHSIAATAERRAEMRAQGLPVDEPIADTACQRRRSRIT